jgi:hypothetical protein
LIKFFTKGEWADAVLGKLGGFDQDGVVFAGGFNIKK